MRRKMRRVIETKKVNPPVDGLGDLLLKSREEVPDEAHTQWGKGGKEEKREGALGEGKSVRF